MPSAEVAASDRTTRRGGEIGLTAAVLLALVTVLMPVLRVTKPGIWLLAAVMLAFFILAAGYVARRFHLPAVAVSLIEFAVWVAFMTAVYFGRTALLLFIPTPATIKAVPLMYERAMEQITNGAAPLDETAALSFMIVGCMGLLAIVIDHVAVTARMPLLAAIGIIAVSLIPSIAVPREVDVPAFVYLAIAILVLLRAETRSREKPTERAAERSAGVPATALGIGAVAIIVAVVATPLLPAPGVRPSGLGPGSGIDATLQLGDDLRRPTQVEVMRIWSSSPGAPYLRATTLSRFDGAIWEPDRVRTVPLLTGTGLGVVSVEDGIRVSDYKTTVQVTNLASRWAPVPFPAIKVANLNGDWAAVPYNRTVISQTSSTQGQKYQVQTAVPQPTLEQIRSLQARSPDPLDETMALPADMPPIIAKDAAAITANQTNDYDRLIALQRWFRGGDFTYSLNAPVQQGFDGSGAQAVAKFLEVKKGYCVHFASAFALMARTLGMPSRIVVGYLPGTATGEKAGKQQIYSVSSQLLHAWPEVYFQNLGWVPFEPTAGLGVPTSFQPAATAVGGTNDPGSSGGSTPEPSASASTNPNDPRLVKDNQASGASQITANPLPALSILVAILFVLALPAIIRRIRAQQMAATARAGDAASAWTFVQDAAIDLAIPVPASETPRRFAYRLVEEYGAPPGDMNTLLIAIEKASYSPVRSRDSLTSEIVTDAAIEVRNAIMRNAPRSRRLLAVLAPRSLMVRPGSLYAAGSSGVTARMR